MSFLGSRSIVFLGTPEPAAVVLRRLLVDGFPIDSVVTRSDARRGRGNETSPSPVKVVALETGLTVHHDIGWLASSTPDSLLGVVVAYGRLIPSAVLDSVPMVNLHFSLLPRWRGAAPVERAILAGDDTTGVCVMEVVPELDAGGVFACREVAIGSLTASQLTARLADVGSDLIAGVLRGESLPAVPQSGEPTYARKIDPSEGLIDWTAEAHSIARVVRALRAHTMYQGRRLIIHDVEVISDVNITGSTASGRAGMCGPDAVVTCGTGAVRLVTVQPEGKPPMEGWQWRRGRQGEAIQLGA